MDKDKLHRLIVNELDFNNVEATSLRERISTPAVGKRLRLRREKMRKDEIARLLSKSGWTYRPGKVVDKVLSLPSDYKGMTIGDVLEKFGEMVIIANRPFDPSCNDCDYIDKCEQWGGAICGALKTALTNNGKPIRRRT